MIVCLSLRLKRDGISGSTNKKLTWHAKCGKGNFGECFMGMGNCLSYDKSGHNVWYCPNFKGQDNCNGKESGSNVDSS